MRGTHIRESQEVPRRSRVSPAHVEMIWVLGVEVLVALGHGKVGLEAKVVLVALAGVTVSESWVKSRAPVVVTSGGRGPRTVPLRLETLLVEKISPKPLGVIYFEQGRLT